MASTDYQKPDEIGTETGEYGNIDEHFKKTDDQKLLEQ